MGAHWPSSSSKLWVTESPSVCGRSDGGWGGTLCGMWVELLSVERYTKGLRSTCLPSPCLLPPVVSESLYSSGIFWVQRGLRSLIFFDLLVYLSFTKTVYYAVNSCAFFRACELQYLIGPGRKFRQTEKAWCKMTNGNSHSASDSRSTIGQGGEWGQPESPWPHLHSPSPADCCRGECRLCIASVYQVKPEYGIFFMWNFSVNKMLPATPNLSLVLSQIKFVCCPNGTL